MTWLTCLSDLILLNDNLKLTFSRRHISFTNCQNTVTLYLFDIYVRKVTKQSDPFWTDKCSRNIPDSFRVYFYIKTRNILGLFLFISQGSRCLVRVHNPPDGSRFVLFLHRQRRFKSIVFKFIRKEDELLPNKGSESPSRLRRERLFVVRTFFRYFI